MYNAYTAHDTDDQKATLLKAIFLRLVEVTEAQEDVRKTVKKEDLAGELAGRYPGEAVNGALDFLASEEARLLRVRRDEQQQVWVEVVHEVLIRRWGQLQGWVKDRRKPCATNPRWSGT